MKLDPLTACAQCDAAAALLHGLWDPPNACVPPLSPPPPPPPLRPAPACGGHFLLYLAVALCVECLVWVLFQDLGLEGFVVIDLTIHSDSNGPGTTPNTQPQQQIAMIVCDKPLPRYCCKRLATLDAAPCAGRGVGARGVRCARQSNSPHRTLACLD
jgi:hypothetical protein